MSKTIVNLIHEFFSTCITYDHAMDFLITNRACKFFEYSLVSSRKMLLALVIYQFGKEIDYPEALQSKARQMILFLLRNNSENVSGTEQERKQIVKEYLVAFDEYKKEDLKKYMYELGIEYAQLDDLKLRLKENETDETWKEQIEHLQKKIREYVHSSNGYDEFQKCLSYLHSMKEQIVEQVMEETYWKMIKEDLEAKRYDLIIANFVDIKNMLLEIHDDQDTKEIMDESYFQQLLENDLFDDRAMLGQIDFIFVKMKKYGIPVYDKLIDKTKEILVKDIQENGLTIDVIVKTFQKTVLMLKFYLDIINIYRKKIKESATI